MGRMTNSRNLAARRYSRALLSLAEEKGGGYADELYGQAQGFLQTLDENVDAAALLASPRVTAREKEEFLRKVFGAGLSEDVYGVIHMLLRKGREGEIRGVFESFCELEREKKGVTTAEVWSAIGLTPEQVEAIRAALEKGLGKTVEIDARTDASLLGGLRVAVDGKVADSTIKKNLESLRKKLTAKEAMPQ